MRGSDVLDEVAARGPGIDRGHDARVEQYRRRHSQQHARVLFDLEQQRGTYDRPGRSRRDHYDGAAAVHPNGAFAGSSGRHGSPGRLHRGHPASDDQGGTLADRAATHQAGNHHPGDRTASATATAASASATAAAFDHRHHPVHPPPERRGRRGCGQLRWSERRRRLRRVTTRLPILIQEGAPSGRGALRWPSVS
ncbi:MAG TPA: hypothetical protein VFH70_12720 [Acidimicrobiales bacterium]|nr:hypothetical protein [Acidimicrobiales bacterium]